MNINIANLRYPAKNDKLFAGERKYSHWYQKTKGLKYPSKINLALCIFPKTPFKDKAKKPKMWWSLIVLREDPGNEVTWLWIRIAGGEVDGDHTMKKKT